MIFLYYGQFEHFGYCENWIAEALDRNGHHCLRVKRATWFDEELLIKIARDNNVTHLLLSKTPEVKPSQLLSIKNAGIKIVFWTFDWMRHPDAWEWYAPLAKIADICFQTDGTGEAEFYRSEFINRVELHQGCVPGLHDFPKPSSFHGSRDMSTLGSDVTFIGSEYTPRRHELVANLKRITDGQWSFAKWGEPGEQLWGQSFAAAVHTSSIVVGDNFVNDVKGYWSDRVYLTLGCGGFFLTAYVPGLEDHFKNHEDLVWWTDFEDLERLIRFYMPREALRRSIALTGYRKVHAFHTYTRRIQKFIHAVEALP